MTYFIPNPALANPPFQYTPSFQSFPGIAGYNLSYPSTSTIVASAGFAKECLSDYNIEYPNVLVGQPPNITLSTAVVGPNGCYPVPLNQTGITSDTMFGVYLCVNSSGVGIGAPTAPTLPCIVIATGNNFLPPGFSAYRRIGLVYINHTTFNIIPMVQSGNANEREYLLQDPIQVVSGSATSMTEVDLTSGAGPIMPFANVMVNFSVSLTAFAAGSYVAMQPNALTASTPSATPTKIEGNVASTTTATNVWMIATPDPTTGDASIKYMVDNAGSTAVIKIAGFRDSLGLNFF